jgi:hypothetical protein
VVELIWSVIAVARFRGRHTRHGADGQD